MKRGGPLRRKAPMKRGTSKLTRTTRVKAKNAPRLEARYVAAFGAFGEFIRGYPCAVPACGVTEVDACHIHGRGAGGKATHVPDKVSGEVRGNLVPMCRAHHDLQGCLGVRRFEAAAGFSMQAVSDRLYAEFIARG